jgi:dTDP-4-dehydrorhamnose reductase
MSGGRVLITGAGGQLGQAMASGWPEADVVSVTRTDLDVTSRRDVDAMIAGVRPTVVINCSAYTNVDGAEDEPETAFAVNAWAPGLIAKAAASAGAVFVHFSTDFVFDGEHAEPYTEEDRPNPRSAYAASKLVGEWLAAEHGRSYVLRVESLFGGPRASSSVDRMLAALRSGAPVRAFVDRSVSPSYVDDVVGATVEIIRRNAPYGLYHCVNSGWTDWATLARELARLAGITGTAIEEVRLADAGLRASRPRFAALSNGKLTRAGVPLPTWQDALARYVAGI